jgi:hypothetical protein
LANKAKHKHITIRHFSFFKAALSHDWKEFYEKRIALRDCEPVTFEGFLQWTHTPEIPLCDEPGAQPLELIKQCILGDFLGDDDFCNYVFVSRRSKHVNGFAAKQMTWSFAERARIRISYEIRWRENKDVEGHGAIGETTLWRYYNDSVANSS